MKKVNELWQLYQRGNDRLNRQGAYSTADEAYRFYEGDQWSGLESGGERLPVYNIIAPLVKYKVAMVADKRVLVSITPSKAAERERCRKIEAQIRACFEHISFSKRQWDILQHACVGGTAFAYLYKGVRGVEMDILESTAVMLANEAEPEIELQDYILIASRQSVESVRAVALENGLAEAASQIVPDGQGDDDSVLTVMKLWKEGGCVHFARATSTAVFQPDTAVTGLSLYPIAKLCWDTVRGSARGRGEVTPLIPNQLEINKSMARMSVALKNSAYPKLAYLAGSVTNPNDLDRVGTPIEVLGSAVGDLDSVLKYLEPGQVNSLAMSFTDAVISKTKELAGQNEAASGSINPENASGSAIIAARDAAALYLSAPTGAFVDFVERVARIMADILCAYGEGEHSLLQESFSVAVEVTRCDAYSKFAGEDALWQLLGGGHITLEEYVNCLEDDSAVPKARLLQIIAERGRAQ